MCSDNQAWSLGFLLFTVPIGCLRERDCCLASLLARTWGVIGGREGGGEREVSVRETGLGEGCRPVLPSGCGSTSAGRHRLWNAEEEERLEEEEEEEVRPGERDAHRSGFMVKAE